MMASKDNNARLTNKTVHSYITIQQLKLHPSRIKIYQLKDCMSTSNDHIFNTPLQVYSEEPYSIDMDKLLEVLSILKSEKSLGMHTLKGTITVSLVIFVSSLIKRRVKGIDTKASTL